LDAEQRNSGQSRASRFIGHRKESDVPERIESLIANWCAAAAVDAIIVSSDRINLPESVWRLANKAKQMFKECHIEEMHFRQAKWPLWRANKEEKSFI